MCDHPSRKEFAAALIAALSWLMFVVLALACSAAASGQSSPCHQAVCRVHNQLGAVANVGSGTLVDKTEDGSQGLVLTCWHLFREGNGKIVVEFGNGQTHGARIVAHDEKADLAALVISKPWPEPVQVGFVLDQNARLSACGFGSSGRYRCAHGIVIGESHGEGQQSLLVSDAVRSGDSGGGVFDEQGRLVAVIWGERSGVTYASHGAPLKNFIERVLGRRTRMVVNCPNGLCPRAAPFNRDRPAGIAKGNAVSRSVDSRFDELTRAIDALQRGKQDRGNYLTRNELAGYVEGEQLEQLENKSQARHESLLTRIRALSAAGGPSLGKAAGAAAVGLLGLSGPAGWAVLAASTFGGWLIGRWVKRKRRGGGGRRRQPFRG